MVQPSAYVLCGGTFLTLLLESRKPSATRRKRVTGETDAFKEEDVLLALLKIVQPDYIKPTGGSFAVHLRFILANIKIALLLVQKI